MQDQEQPGDAGKEYSPGGIIGNGEPTLVWLDSTERIFTAEDLRRMRRASGEEWNEGEVP